MLYFIYNQISDAVRVGQVRDAYDLPPPAHTPFATQLVIIGVIVLLNVVMIVTVITFQ